MTMRNAVILVLIIALVTAASLTLSTSQTPIVARDQEREPLPVIRTILAMRLPRFVSKHLPVKPLLIWAKKLLPIKVD